VVGTSTLEKKNKDLNRATRELEAKMRNLQQRTETDKVSTQGSYTRKRAVANSVQ
jgi:hypothetical protein